MSDIEFEESNSWRTHIISTLHSRVGSKVKCCNPNDYFNFEEICHETEREVRNFDLNKLRKSDLIVVNFNAPNSIGTAQELAIANEHRIPVIGLNECNYELHPWLTECCERIFYKMDQLLDYIIYFYLR